jgi:hypothetical protein
MRQQFGFGGLKETSIWFGALKETAIWFWWVEGDSNLFCEFLF